MKVKEVSTERRERGRDNSGIGKVVSLPKVLMFFYSKKEEIQLCKNKGNVFKCLIVSGQSPS